MTEIASMIESMGFSVTCVIGLAWYVNKIHKETLALQQKQMENSERTIKEAQEANKDKLNEAEKATNELGNEMDDTSKKTNLFGEVLKANLASDLIQNGIKKIIDGFKKLKDSIVSYVNTGIELPTSRGKTASRCTD